MCTSSRKSKSFLFTDSPYAENIDKTLTNYNDKLIFKGITTQSFPFTLKNNSILTEKGFTGTLGLGISESLNNILFDTLKSNNAITNKYITISVSPTETKTYFKEELPPDKNKKQICKLSERKDLEKKYKESWVCYYSHMFFCKSGNLDRLKFEDIEAVFGRVVFDLTSRYITIPIEWGEYIIKKFEIEDYAKIILDDEGNGYLDINNLSQELINNFFIVLDGISYGIKASNLFEINSDDTVISYIKFTKEQNNIWTLGYPFFINYNISFNYDDASVYISGGNVIDFRNDYEKWKNNNLLFLNKENFDKYILIIGFVIGLILFIVVCIKICRSCCDKKEKIDSQLIEEH